MKQVRDAVFIYIYILVLNSGRLKSYQSSVHIVDLKTHHVLLLIFNKLLSSMCMLNFNSTVCRNQ